MCSIARYTFTLLVAIVIATLAPLSAQCQEKIEKAEFRLTLPYGWVEIPKEVLQLAGEEIRRSGAKIALSRFDYGFQPQSNARWLQYPYMVVEVQKHTVVNAAYLRRLYAAFQAAPATNPTSRNEMFFDEKLGALIAITEIPDQRQLTSFAVTIPMKDGVLQFLAYVPSTSFAGYRPALESIARSIEMTQEHVIEVTDGTDEEAAEPGSSRLVLMVAGLLALNFGAWRLGRYARRHGVKTISRPSWIKVPEFLRRKKM